MIDAVFKPEAQEAAAAIGASYVLALLDAEEREVEFYQLPGEGRDTSGSSVFAEATARGPEMEARTLRARTLDDVAARLGAPFDLIKLDAQGAELRILAGGGETLKAAQVLIMEVAFAGDLYHGAPGFAEAIAAAAARGFAPFGFAEVVRVDGVLVQADMVFARVDSPVFSRLQRSIGDMGKANEVVRSSAAYHASNTV